MSETDLAYLAGIIDGEGSISIFTRPGGRSRGMPSERAPRRYHKVLVHVSNTDERLLLWIQDRFGGRLRCHEYNRSRNARPLFKLVWEGKPAGELLLQIRPFLVIKGEQADLGIALRARTGKLGGPRVSNEEYGGRQDLLQRIRVLNARGRAS